MGAAQEVYDRGACASECAYAGGHPVDDEGFAGRSICFEGTSRDAYRTGVYVERLQARNDQTQYEGSHDASRICVRRGSAEASEPGKPAPVYCGLELHKTGDGMFHVIMIDVSLPEACTLWAV